MPRVARLSIAPVRSLGLEHPDQVDVTEVGVAEDRRFFLADDTNRLVDRLIVGELVQIAAHTDPGGTRLRLAFPDGTVVDDEVVLGDPIETPIHGRTGVGHVVVGPWTEPLSDFTAAARSPSSGATGRAARGRATRPASSAMGRSPSWPATRAWRRWTPGGSGCSSRSKGSPPTRKTPGSAAGSRSAIAVLAVTLPDARCAITTQHPDTGVRDLDTLRTIIAYRGLRDGKHADFGVLADVAATRAGSGRGRGRRHLT